MQASVDSIYNVFKNRVANGRTKDISYIDSIAQGHVYTGSRALQLALTDKTGTLQDAVDCAARMAKLKEYGTKEYPEKKSFWEELLNSSSYKASMQENAIKENIGNQQYSILQQVKKLKVLMQAPQTRLPFDFDIK